MNPSEKIRPLSEVISGDEKYQVHIPNPITDSYEKVEKWNRRQERWKRNKDKNDSTRKPDQD